MTGWWRRVRSLSLRIASRWQLKNCCSKAPAGGRSPDVAREPWPAREAAGRSASGIRGEIPGCHGEHGRAQDFLKLIGETPVEVAGDGGEGVEDRRVEMPAAPILQDCDSLLDGHRVLVGAARGEGIEHVDHGEDAGADRD